jgi:hypothetical protein
MLMCAARSLSGAGIGTGRMQSSAAAVFIRMMVDILHVSRAKSKHQSI